MLCVCVNIMAISKAALDFCCILESWQQQNLQPGQWLDSNIARLIFEMWCCARLSELPWYELWHLACRAGDGALENVSCPFGKAGLLHFLKESTLWEPEELSFLADRSRWSWYRYHDKKNKTCVCWSIWMVGQNKEDQIFEIVDGDVIRVGQTDYTICILRSLFSSKNGKCSGWDEKRARIMLDPGVCGTRLVYKVGTFMKMLETTDFVYVKSLYLN